MNKKQAVDIVSQIARENARAWLAQMTRNGEIYYAAEYVNRDRDSHHITLAVGIESQGRPALDFFWPCPVPQYSSDDPGAEARTLLGHSEAVSVAAKAVGFSLKYRCFVTGGGGMDMTHATLDNLAGRVGYTGSLDVQRTSMLRREGHN